MIVDHLTSADAGWLEAYLERHSGRLIARNGELLDGLEHPGFHVEREAVLLYIDHDADCELLYIASERQWSGLGTALVVALVAHRPEVPIRVTTTNDNVDALRFYQRRGFRLLELRAGELARSRRLKPQIPPVGAHGIPLRDELELVREP